MLPTSRSKALADVLDQLDAAAHASRAPLQLRVRMRDGTLLEGRLAGASRQQLALQMGHSTQELTAEEIRSIESGASSWFGLGPTKWTLWFDAGTPN